MDQGVKFIVDKKDLSTQARTGVLITPHGAVSTPVFMPVGTQGTVKFLLPEMLKEAGVEMVLGNTYHLYLRPGHEIIRKLGGLHTFMNWDRALLTDSGGFQVYSLSALRQVTEEGIIFKSHIDGSKHLITPELAMNIQEALGADIVMCLDDCPPYGVDFATAERSVKRTLKWAHLCREAKKLPTQALFGIVQGACYPKLRSRAAEELKVMGFDGYAIGGLSVGEPKEMMFEIIAHTAAFLPPSSPRYVMGAGMPVDIVRAVSFGIDMFDCVIPTRCARHGLLFTNGEKVVIRNARYREDERPLDETCDCYTCRKYSRAYLRHLFVAKEALAMTLATIHNIRYYMRLMERIRESIGKGRYGEFMEEFIKKGGWENDR